MGYRVASLLPAATEIVCAVGAEADLVGISHECDFPEAVRGLPALTRARVHPVGTSREIDREVRLVLQSALAGRVVFRDSLAQFSRLHDCQRKDSGLPCCRALFLCYPLERVRLTPRD